ncbi:fibronectin type III domain-containing protein [Flavobacterium sp. HJJ]|uniref:fibronectin type III domain-containing protein n=1 Tax=Flavobacterium sp. HJJ TaxID=2783792 RepID=UPI00188A69C3|nr:fibronectin type III domain-containing protein [Flavobacterium sp. HJJ]MBF4470617.1 fibronectin type III domain-containing protein [Flavobacterium sp. HJJ]
MKNFLKNIYFFVLFLFFNAVGYAQLYPVQLTPVFNSPYSVKISDYATSMDTKMKLLINPTDISISQRRVRLKLYIQGNGLNIQTSDYAQEQRPIFINGGELQTLTNTDIAALFRLENLQGITPAQYANPLPEGMYNFCFEMYDFVTNQKISQKSCASLYLILNDPPILNTPQKNEQIASTEFPNILFTWTPRQINATNVSYKFELKQLIDPALDPQFAFQMSPILYEETLFGTALLYNLGMPILTPGLRYAWRVKAVSTTGLSENAIFKNDGYSEIYSFKYTSSCAAPTFLLSESQSSKSVKITWEGTPEHTRYQVQYKKQDVRNAQWFSANSLNKQSLINNLEPGVTYQFRVGSSCDPATEGVQSFTYSAISTFTIPTETSGVAAYNCGIIPQINIENQKVLDNLIQSETFKAGDFPVTVLELEKQHSPYSGHGYIIVPYLADTKIAVEFKNILINTDYQLISGVVETSYNPDWKNITDVEDFTGEGQGGQIEETVPFEVDKIVINPNGDIIVNGKDGEQVTIPGGKDTVITDSKGNIYNVDKDGNGSNEPAIAAAGGKPTPENTDGVDESGQATEFTAKGISIAFSGNGSKYAFDVIPDKAPTALEKLYKKVGDVVLPYKAVLNGYSDTVLATVTLTDINIQLDSIVFKTQNGANIDFKRTDKVFVLTVKGKLSYAEEQILATIKQGDRWKVIGAFMLVHISSKEVNVALVPTDAVSQSKLDGIITNTQAIYDKIGVKVNFKKEGILNIDSVVSGNTIQTEKNTLTSTYSTDQQKINALYQSTESSYVLFVTDKNSSTGQQGYMRLNGQFGYVFKSGLTKTPAHELGHGIFKLEHPFETYKTTESSTDLLMDYSSGTVLSHQDWKQVNDPAFKLYAFQSQESGEQITTVCNYILPNNQPFKFSDIDGKKAGDVILVTSNNNGGFPNGTLYSFRINSIDYKYDTDTKIFVPAYYNNYKAADSKNSFRLIVQSQTNDCNYYLIAKKINDTNAKLDLSIPNAAKPIIVCENNGQIPLNEISIGINTLLAQIKNCSPSLVNTNFSDEDAKKYLSADDRYNLMKCILQGVVTNKEENLIIRVLQTAPVEQSKNLLNLFSKDETGLLKDIQNGFQLGNYREIYRLLSKIFYEGSDPIVIKNQIEEIKKLYNDETKNGTQKIYYSDLPALKSVVWLNKGFLERLAEFDLNSIHFANDEAVFNDKGEVSFETEWSNFLLSSGIAKYTDIKPFSILSFELASDEPNLSAKKGDKLYAPAFMVPFLVNEKFNKEAADAVNVAVIVGTAGSGDLAEGGAATAWATFDIAFSATALTVDSYRTQIEGTEAGKTFLHGWETFNKVFLAYMALKLSAATFEVSINTFKTSWQSYKSSGGFLNFKSLNPSAAGRLENEMETLFKEAEKAEGASVVNEVGEVANEINNSVTKNLINLKVSASDVDEIIKKAMLIDNEIGNNQMMKMIDDLAKNPKFKNPEDLLKNLNGCFTKNTVKSDKALSLMNELNEGKYWLNRGEEVIVSKELTPGKNPPNEVDVVFSSGYNKGILECKRPATPGPNAENNVYANLKLIIEKFKDVKKLTQNWKDLYPKRFGQIEIANGSFSNLNSAKEFVDAIKNKGLIGLGDGKMFTLEELQSLEELHIIVNSKRIIIKPTDW